MGTFNGALRNFEGDISIDSVKFDGDTLISQNVETTTADTTASENSIILADASGGNVTVELPTPSDSVDVAVKKIDSSSNVVSVTTPGAETIDAVTKITISNQFVSVKIVSDGADYFIID
jgi:hypothetical protein